jgi:hypothetical protein
LDWWSFWGCGEGERWEDPEDPSSIDIEEESFFFDLTEENILIALSAKGRVAATLTKLKV